MSTTVVLPANAEAASNEQVGSVDRVLERMRHVGFAVLGLQLMALMAWSTVLARRFALTWDFSIYHQAWWLIAHGDLNPFDSVRGVPFWMNHGEFLFWPLGLLAFVWPHAVTLLWVQCVALVGAEAVAFAWLCDLAVDAGACRRDRRVTLVLASVGLVLLLVDPWIYWSISFDFHFELVGIVFVLLAARDLYRDPKRRRIWLWVGLALLCGDVVATYVVAIGLSAMLAGPRWRRSGLAVAGAGLAWVLLLTALHANRGSGLVGGYGYLAVGAGVPVSTGLGLAQIAPGILRHPQHVVAVLWDRRLDLYAVVSSGGLFGVLSPWVVTAAILILLENSLNHYLGFIAPGYQDVLLFVLLPVGTVGVLAMLARRHPRWAIVIASVVAINAVGWGAMWIPRTAGQWLRVSPDAAAMLSSVERQIPSSDEVIASQGVSGRFSGRRWMYTVQGPGAFPVRTSPVWVIVAPSQGTETAAVDVSDAFIAELAGPLHAEPVVQGSGVWAFRWVPPSGTRTLTVPTAVPTIAGWTVTGPAGLALTTGPEANWRAAATGRPGYVVAGDYWRKPPGEYQATVVLSSTEFIRVEVWNATGDALLARRNIPPTNGLRAVSLNVDARRAYSEHAYGGEGPFSILPVAPPPGNRLEIRVWTPSGGLVSVASLELVPMSS